MKKENKKAFTIVELVIVIAVIAILAAVMIPTFSNVIDKAKKSKDIQTVENMNIAVAMLDAEDEVQNLTDVMYAIALENYTSVETAKEGCQFMWDPETNKILYVDEYYNVLNLEGYDPLDHENWFALSFTEEPLSNNSSSYSDLFD